MAQIILKSEKAGLSKILLKLIQCVIDFKSNESKEETISLSVLDFTKILLNGNLPGCDLAFDKAWVRVDEVWAVLEKNYPRHQEMLGNNGEIIIFNGEKVVIHKRKGLGL